MGLLDSAPGGVEDTVSEDTTAETESAQTVVEAAPEAPKQRVEIQESKPSRRQAAARAQDAVMTKVTELERALSAKEQSWQQELARRDAEIARLQGMAEGFKATAAQQKPQGPTPEELEAQAEKALDASNYAEHRRLVNAANELRWQQREQALLQKFQQQQPQATQGLPVPVQLALAQHPAVRSAGERGLALANAKAMELVALYGQQPDTLERAFQAAEAMLSGTQKQPQTFSRETAGALAGVPAARNGNGGGSRSPGVELTALEMDVARKAGMSYAEYAKEIAAAFPERVRQ